MAFIQGRHLLSSASITSGHYSRAATKGVAFNQVNTVHSHEIMNLDCKLSLFQSYGELNSTLRYLNHLVCSLLTFASKFRLKVHTVIRYK